VIAGHHHPIQLAKVIAEEGVVTHGLGSVKTPRWSNFMMAVLCLTLRSDACAPGACYEGYCEGNNPNDYSLNGKCGGVTGFKICTGLFGSCCNMNGRCGDGLGFCDTANCSYGNCTIAANATISAPSPTATLPPSSSDGKCGGPNGTMCNNVFGYCCGGDGVCGDGLAACGSGW
jgi:hypothetical protein